MSNFISSCLKYLRRSSNSVPCLHNTFEWPHYEKISTILATLLGGGLQNGFDGYESERSVLSADVNQAEPPADSETQRQLRQAQK